MAPLAGSAPSGLRSPAQERRVWLESVFGTEYFEREREQLVLTAVSDIPGLTKVVHKFEARLMEAFGDVVELRRELIKEEEHRRFQWATAYRDRRGMESRLALPHVCRAPEAVSLPNICAVPEGVRVHPYLRDRLPTLELLLLWQDAITGEPRGRTILSVEHPMLPTEADLPQLLEEVAPYLQKRPLCIRLRTPPEHVEVRTSDACPAAANLCVEVLACHPASYDSAATAQEEPGQEEKTGAPQCLLAPPLRFSGVTDQQGVMKLCFLPATVNKIRVFESELFCSKEEELFAEKMTPPGEGVTNLTFELVPKAQASLAVRVFAMPGSIPVEADAGGGLVDWSLCEPLKPLPQAVVELLPFEESGGVTTPLPLGMAKEPEEHGTFEIGLIKEGAVELTATCEGYKPHRQPLLLLVGENRFSVPLEPL